MVESGCDQLFEVVVYGWHQSGVLPCSIRRVLAVVHAGAGSHLGPREEDAVTTNKVAALTPKLPVVVKTVRGQTLRPCLEELANFAPILSQLCREDNKRLPVHRVMTA